MRHLVLLASATLFISYLAMAQLTRIEQQIHAYPENDNEVISKARRMIKGYIKSKNITEVDSIVTYLENRYDTSTRRAPFFEIEEYELNFILNRFSKLLDTNYLKSFSYTVNFPIVYMYRCSPGYDSLLYFVKDEFTLNRDVYATTITHLRLKEFENDFLLLFLDYLSSTHNLYLDSSQFKINNRADDYFSKYPDSPYNTFIRANIRWVYKVSDWAWGFDLGASMMPFSGNLHEYFNTAWGFNLAFIGQYKSLYSYFRMQFGAGSVRQQFIYNGSWDEGLKIDAFLLELTFGTPLYSDRSLRIIPFLGPSVATISTPSDVKNHDGKDVSTTMFSYTYGVNIDLCGRHDSSDLRDASKMLIQLGFGYTKGFSPPQPNFQGGSMYLQLSFGFILHTLDRVW